MTDLDRCTRVARRAQEICKSFDPGLTCDVFDAGESEEYAKLDPMNPPKEGQLGINVIGQINSNFDREDLVRELETIGDVWKVFLTFTPTNSLS